MQIDTVVYFNIFNPELFTYGVSDPIMALANLTATTLRNIIGELELDQTLTSRDHINGRMQTILDEATDKWGIKVNRVELKNIMPPRDIQEAMEKQMRAEREKRRTLLESEAHKESAVLRAEGDKQAMILQAEARRDAAIAEATGRAESIRLVYEAETEGLRRMSEVTLSEGVVLVKKLDALRALGDGRATKIIVPSELAESASSLTMKGDLLGITQKADDSPKETPTSESKDDCCDDEDRSPVTKALASDRGLVGTEHQTPASGGANTSQRSSQKPGQQFQQRGRPASEQ